MAKSAEEWAVHARDVINAIEDMDDWRAKGLVFADLIEDTRKRDAEIATEAAAREREACALIADRFTCGLCGADGKAAAAIRARQAPRGRVPTAGELAHDYIDNTLNSVVKP